MFRGTGDVPQIKENRLKTHKGCEYEIEEYRPGHFNYFIYIWNELKSASEPFHMYEEAEVECLRRINNLMELADEKDWGV